MFGKKFLENFLISFLKFFLDFFSSGVGFFSWKSFGKGFGIFLEKFGKGFGIFLKRFLEICLENFWKTFERVPAQPRKKKPNSNNSY